MTNQHVFIIAEAGVNHNGSLKRALKMIDEASVAGVDGVKFQAWKAENLVTKTAVKAEYQKNQQVTKRRNWKCYVRWNCLLMITGC